MLFYCDNGAKMGAFFKFQSIEVNVSYGDAANKEQLSEAKALKFKSPLFCAVAP